MSIRRHLLFFTSLTAIGLGGAAPALAEAAPGAAAAPVRVATADEITVTARRRDESIVDVPLAIAVVTDTKLRQLDIKTTSDLANYVPGLTFNNYTAGDARNDRGPDRPIIMRGLNTGIGTSAGARLFLDGAYVSGNEVPASMDIGQVEILRGPQSVYFGRATMTGAVAYRTKNIGDEWGGSFEGVYGERDERDLQLSVAGPVVPGMLKLRLTGLYEASGGYVRNDYNNGASNLGETSRKSVSATIIATPTSTIELRAFANWFRDSDGPGATAFIPTTFDNCKFPGATYGTFCGEIPDKSHSFHYSNTFIPANVAQIIFATPIMEHTGFRHKIGTQQVAFNSHLVANWQMTDYLRLTSITGYHTNSNVAAVDGIQREPIGPAFPYQVFDYTYATRRNDISQELRLSSDPNRRLSWTFGGNYVFQKTLITAFTGIITASGTFLPLPQPLRPNTSETYGIFGGAYYKLTDRATLSAEGRWQSDTIAVPSFNLQEAFHSFVPRVAVDYDIGGNRRVYASYAEGNQPGGFNTSIDNYRNNPAAIAQIEQFLGTTTDFFREEKLKIAEFGIKGHIFDGRGFFDLNTYYGRLINQQVYENALIPILKFSVSATNNAGQSTIYGVEWQGSYNFDPHLSVSTTFAWNHTKRNKYLNVSGVAQFGTTDFDGKAFPYVPEISGSAVLSYDRDIADGWLGYSNGSVTYRGKQYVDEYNAAWIPGRWQVDLRAGVRHGAYSLEAYVRNLFNDESYTGGSVAPDYGTGASYAFFGAWAPPRTFGLRLLADF